MAAVLAMHSVKLLTLAQTTAVEIYRINHLLYSSVVKITKYLTLRLYFHPFGL